MIFPWKSKALFTSTIYLIKANWEPARPGINRLKQRPARHRLLHQPPQEAPAILQPKARQKRRMTPQQRHPHLPRMPLGLLSEETKCLRGNCYKWEASHETKNQFRQKLHPEILHGTRGKNDIRLVDAGVSGRYLRGHNETPQVRQVHSTINRAMQQRPTINRTRTFHRRPESCS